MANRVLPATTGEAGEPSGQAERPVNIAWSRKYLPIDTVTSAFPAQGPWPNKGVELTAYSVRSYVASASSRSSRLAFGTENLRGLVIRRRGRDTMSAEENKAIARRHFDAWNTENVALLHEIASADYVFHDSGGRVVRGIPGGAIPRFRAAFPDWTYGRETAIFGNKL
jgi:hypothetical protein